MRGNLQASCWHGSALPFSTVDSGATIVSHACCSKSLHESSSCTDRISLVFQPSVRVWLVTACLMKRISIWLLWPSVFKISLDSLEWTLRPLIAHMPPAADLGPSAIPSSMCSSLFCSPVLAFGAAALSLDITDSTAVLPNPCGRFCPQSGHSFRPWSPAYRVALAKAQYHNRLVVHASLHW